MPRSRESSVRFFASCSAYGTLGSVQPPQTPKCLQYKFVSVFPCFCVSVCDFHFTSSKSTSKTRVAFGGITPPAPRGP